MIKKSNQSNEFVSIVGHEIRTPLTSIRWYISMMLDGDMGEINKEMRNALNHSYDSTVRLINLVNDLLSLWKIESWKMEYYMENTSIIDTLKSVYKDMFMEMERSEINFKVNISDELHGIKINVDKNKLKQILLNLLTNALKFTNKWGNIELKASIIKTSVRFEIIDNGDGIPKDKIDTICDKFIQVESHMQRKNTSGIGLWLSIVKNFLEEFDSKIQIDSENKKGSNFYFDMKIVD